MTTVTDAATAAQIYQLYIKAGQEQVRTQPEPEVLQAAHGLSPASPTRAESALYG